MENISKIQAPTKPIVFKKKRINNFVYDLKCVFRPFEVIRNKLNHEVERVIYTGPLCLRKAPRRTTISRGLPKFQNKFGEPLCEKHSVFGYNEFAFPGEATTEYSDQTKDEQLKEYEKILSLFEVE